MYTFTNTLPKRDRKMKNCFDVFSVEIAIAKNRKKVKNVFKTNVLVPKTNVWEKKRAPRSTFFRRPFCFPYLSSAGSFVILSGRSGSVLPWKPSNLQRESSINYHKCPNYETPAFSVIWLTLQNRWNKWTKMQMNLIKTYPINTNK